MGFLVLAKHGLNSKVGFKTKFGLQTREKRVEEEEKGEEEEEEEEEEGGAKKCMETNLEYGFYDFWYGIVWIFGFCMKLCVFGPW